MSQRRRAEKATDFMTSATWRSGKPYTMQTIRRSWLLGARGKGERDEKIKYRESLGW